MDENKARLLGMHAGDGTLYRTNNKGLVWELRGSKEEKEFYDKFICDLLKEIFDINIIAKNRSGGANGCYGIQTCNKAIIGFLLEEGFSVGSKVYTVRIPSKIKNASRKIKQSFIGGLFDTDGCVRLDKNRTNKPYYPRIEFGFASQKLRDDLFALLLGLKFKAYKWEDSESFRLGLAGFENLKKWFKEIKPKNPKHFKRVLALKNYAPMAQWYGADLNFCLS